MICQRCQGLMVEDHLLDMEESYGRPWIRGWRCVCCGDIVDPLIRRHRILQSSVRSELAKLPSSKRKRSLVGMRA